MPRPLQELLVSAIDQLSRSGNRQPRWDAELLLASLLKRDRAFVLSHPEEPIGSPEQLLFQAWVKKRASGYPLQYIRGEQEFFGRSFLVTEDVLIPRPETELLVEASLERLPHPSARVLDLGTGSGCLAVTLACEAPALRVAATELSAPALRVAKRNARRHRVDHRIDFRLGDTVAPFLGEEPFDLIVANPPYVAFEDPRVMPEVRQFEPRLALFASGEGLDIIRRISQQAPQVLSPRGRLLLEIGQGQKEQVIELAGSLGGSAEDVLCDLAGIERCLCLKFPSPASRDRP